LTWLAGLAQSGFAIGLIIALFVVMKPHLFAGLIQ
jgi:hypothetical protein